MEENELRENEVNEAEVEQEVQQESVVEEEVVENAEEVEEAQETEEEPKKTSPIDWNRFNLGSKCKDIGLISYFGSNFIRAFSGNFAESEASQRLFISVYVYVPSIIAILGVVIGILGLIKSKGKWDSVIGILINATVIVTSVVLMNQMKAMGF